MSGLANDLLRLPEVSFEALQRGWIGLLFLPVLLLPLARLPRRRAAALALLLRAAALAALLAVVLEPAVDETRERRGRLLVLADVSPSVGDEGRAEASRLLSLARTPFDLVAFGASPRFVGEALRAAPLDADPREATDVAAALRFAAARAGTAVPLRVVVLSDGRPTTAGADEAAMQLRGHGREVHALGLDAGARAGPPGIAVRAVAAPEGTEPGAPVAIRAAVHADADTVARATLYVDGRPLAEREVRLRRGDQSVDFEGIVLEPGRHLAQVLVDGDATPGDNLGGTPVVVAGVPRVICLAAAKRRSLLAEALAKQGMQVEVAAAADARDLAPFDLVVLLPDAPAAALEERAAALAELLGRGGGVVAVGGAAGPGLARLHGTPTAFLLPVSVEPRATPEPEPPAPREEPKPRVEIVEEETEAYPITLCLVVDRSGSMAGPKMERAKQAAAAAALALTREDRVAVVAFGDRAELVLAPRRAGSADAVEEALAGIEADGQTAMFEALRLAFAVLEREETPIRHAVLVSDGRPSIDGPWLDLVRGATERKITLSAVGIGWDIDRFFLAQLSKWGAGRYWSATHPHEIPQVVTQDTKRIVAARDRRGKDAERPLPEPEPKEPEPGPKPPPEPKEPPPPVAPVALVADPAAPREMLKGVADEDLPRVAHLEEAEPRFAAWVAVRDAEKGRPVVAYRRVGLGTSAALLVDPEAEPELRAHPELPRLLAQLARSALPDVDAAPLAVEHLVVEAPGERRLEVRVVGEDGLPRTDLPVEASGLELTRRADRYEAVLPPDERPRTVTVRVGSLLERSFVVPPAASAERAATGADRAALVRLAGDPARVDGPAGQVLDAPTDRVPFRRPLPLPFLLLAAILLPLDAWARRRLLSGSR